MAEWVEALSCGAEGHGFELPTGQPGPEKHSQPSSKWVPLPNQGYLKTAERKEIDWLHVSYAVPKIQQASNTYCFNATTLWETITFTPLYRETNVVLSVISLGRKMSH